MKLDSESGGLRALAVREEDVLSPVAKKKIVARLSSTRAHRTSDVDGVAERSIPSLPPLKVRARLDTVVTRRLLLESS
jgi:hypothetical protein